MNALRKTAKQRVSASALLIQRRGRTRAWTRLSDPGGRLANGAS
jgi:hypothetical protein